MSINIQIIKQKKIEHQRIKFKFPKKKYLSHLHIHDKEYFVMFVCS